MKYAVIGYPVKHSLSPVMHEAGFKTAGIKASYSVFPVRPDELVQGIEYLKNNGYNGWNVTYPYKEAILPFLNQLSPHASFIGAVNTVKAENGLLMGFNTDGEGFVYSLTSKGYDFTSKNIVLLGAGGAAKSIAAALAVLNTKILILNRTESKARFLSDLVHTLGGTASWGSLKSGEWLKHVDLLIQTTPVGMKGENYPLDLKQINTSALVVDLIYYPACTAFLSQASALGCRTMNGLEMLLGQGILAWKIWLGCDAPVMEMRHSLLNTLKRMEKNEER